MRYLKKYESHEDIHKICQKWGIENYTINDDGSIDVHYNYVNLSRTNLDKLPLNFSKISDSFYCRYNNLTSLEGCPKSVGGAFSCENNNLTSLRGCPKFVGSSFSCCDNNIDTFQGLDFVHIGRYFYCSGNPIYKVWRLFEDHTKFEFFNDCDIIRENRVIILDRLNFFLDYIDMPTVTEVECYKCI